MFECQSFLMQLIDRPCLVGELLQRLLIHTTPALTATTLKHIQTTLSTRSVSTTLRHTQFLAGRETHALLIITVADTLWTHVQWCPSNDMTVLHTVSCQLKRLHENSLSDVADSNICTTHEMNKHRVEDRRRIIPEPANRSTVESTFVIMPVFDASRPCTLCQ